MLAFLSNLSKFCFLNGDNVNLERPLVLGPSCPYLTSFEYVPSYSFAALPGPGATGMNGTFITKLEVIKVA